MNFIKKTYPAFEHAGFRIYFLISLLGEMGVWIEFTGQQWLVYTMTQSAVKLGILASMQFIPALLLSLHAGVFADRYSKKKILYFTEASLGLLSVIIGLLVYFDRIEYWHVLAMAFYSGIANTIDLPARQAFLNELVGDKALRNAINLNSMTVNMARFAGPAVAAILINYFGLAYSFLFNGAVFVPILIGLFLIKPEFNITSKKVKENVFEGIRSGLNYVKSSVRLRVPLLALAFVSMIMWNFTVVTPIFAGQVVKGEVSTFGELSSALGLGSFIGATIASTWLKKDPDMKSMFFFAALFHVAFLTASYLTDLYHAIIGFFFMGIVNILYLTSTNAMIQMNSAHEYRGRVMSLYNLVFFGVTPFGSMFTGWIFDTFTPVVGIKMLSFISAIVVSLVVYFTRDRSKPLSALFTEN